MMTNKMNYNMMHGPINNTEYFKKYFHYLADSVHDFNMFIYDYIYRNSPEEKLNNMLTFYFTKYDKNLDYIPPNSPEEKSENKIYELNEIQEYQLRKIVLSKSNGNVNYTIPPQKNY